MPDSHHWCTAGYRATSTDFVMSEEDKRVIEELEKLGLKYTLVDLGQASAITRLKAKIEGNNSTPTLVYKGQKLKGSQQILLKLELLAGT